MKKLLLCAVCLLFGVVVTFAHPGSTDSNGGHYDRSTGEYHYHHGYPAHQHTGGICPYDYDDRTGWNSGTSGGSSSSNVTRTESQTDDTDNGFKIGLGLVVFPLLLLGIFGFFDWAISHIRSFFKNCAFVLSGRSRKAAAQLRTELDEIKAHYQRLTNIPMDDLLRTELDEIKAGYQRLANINVDDLRRSCHVPADSYLSVADLLPYSNDDIGPFGRYTVWLNHRGDIYHDPGCRYFSADCPINAINLPRNAQPCRKCRPLLPDTTWVAPYRKILKSLCNFHVHDKFPE